MLATQAGMRPPPLVRVLRATGGLVSLTGDDTSAVEAPPLEVFCDAPGRNRTCDLRSGGVRKPYIGLRESVGMAQ